MGLCSNYIYRPFINKDVTNFQNALMVEPVECIQRPAGKGLFKAQRHSKQACGEEGHGECIHGGTKAKGGSAKFFFFFFIFEFPRSKMVGVSVSGVLSHVGEH